MKPLFFSFSFILLSSFDVCAQTPVYGEATMFGYDAAGNRIIRFYAPNVVINRQGYSVNQSSPADTIPTAKFQSNLLLKAYPNPASDYVVIENLSWKTGDKAELKLYDIAGKFILSKITTNSKEELGLSQLAVGTYQVHYYLNGRQVNTWKIVKR